MRHIQTVSAILFHLPKAHPSHSFYSGRAGKSQRKYLVILYEQLLESDFIWMFNDLLEGRDKALITHVSSATTHSIFDELANVIVYVNFNLNHFLLVPVRDSHFVTLLRRIDHYSHLNGLAYLLCRNGDLLRSLSFSLVSVFFVLSRRNGAFKRDNLL